MKLKELLQFVLENKKVIFVFTGVATLLYAILLYIVYPITFVSQATVLPPETSSTPGLSIMLQGGDFSNLLGGGQKASSQLYAEVIKSRTASEFVVDTLGLQKHFQTETINGAVTELQKSLEVEVTKEGLIKVGVPISTSWFSRFSGEIDSVRKLSASVSNMYIAALDNINREKISSDGRRARMYIEAQIKTTKSALDSAEQKLAAFQKQNKTVSLPDQMKATIESAAKLRGEIITQEINFAFLAQNLRENNLTLQATKLRLDELKAQYEKLGNGTDDLMLSLGDAPEIGVKLVNLTRDVQILNQVFLMLNQQYYKEMIQEQKDIATVDMLDKAIVPERAVSPRLVFSTGIAALSFFLIALFITLYNKGFLNTRNTNE